MAFTVSQLSSERFEKITYKHNAAVNAWEPINVEGLGPLIPVANTKANLFCVYYRFGIFKFTVANVTQLPQVKMFTTTEQTRLFRKYSLTLAFISVRHCRVELETNRYGKCRGVTQ